MRITTMQLKSVLIWWMGLYLFGNTHIVIEAPSENCCVLPPSLSQEISKKYPDKRIVTLTDLIDYNRKLFQKDHDGQCPGAARVNFYGDGKPTWAIVLIWGENPNRKAELIVAHEVGEVWETRSVETTDGTPVVWRQRPGKYEGMAEPKPIRAKSPVIVLCGYGSWAVLYAWTGKEVQKLQISD
jgi:hypothetical protein